MEKGCDTNHFFYEFFESGSCFQVTSSQYCQESLWYLGFGFRLLHRFLSWFMTEVLILRSKLHCI